MEEQPTKKDYSTIKKQMKDHGVLGFMRNGSSEGECPNRIQVSKYPDDYVENNNWFEIHVADKGCFDSCPFGTDPNFFGSLTAEIHEFCMVDKGFVGKVFDYVLELNGAIKSRNDFINKMGEKFVSWDYDTIPEGVVDKFTIVTSGTFWSDEEETT